MTSYVSRELIPCAFVWLDPGITPCWKRQKWTDRNFSLCARRNRYFV